jgi:hypothetical protein
MGVLVKKKLIDEDLVYETLGRARELPIPPLGKSLTSSTKRGGARDVRSPLGALAGVYY